MDWFHRLLGQERCRHCRSRTRRPARGLTPAPFRSGRGKGLPERCADCRARQDRERLYLQRLRDAAVPAASEDLTARLLARTEHLARLPRNESAGRNPVPDRAPGTGRRRRLSGVRLAGAATGGTAAAVTLLAGAAYLMGGNPGPAGGLGISGLPDATPAETLTYGQLTDLRARGWACPDLHEAGFHLIRARVAAVDGAQVVELQLTDGQRFATILEQHAAPAPDPQASPRRRACSRQSTS